MNVLFTKQFLKDLSIIPTKFRSKIEIYVFTHLPELTSFSDSQKIESMKGYKNYFKVRFGNYRIGLEKRGENIIIKRVLHRKEIYRYFP